MRYVLYKDASGKIRRSLVRDKDGDEMAQYGLPAGPPNLDAIDWELVKTQINNAFVEAGVFKLSDLQRSVILETVGNIVKRHVLDLFREEDKKTRKPQPQE